MCLLHRAVGRFKNPGLGECGRHNLAPRLKIRLTYLSKSRGATSYPPTPPVPTALIYRPALLRQIRDLARLFPATLMYLLNNASGACQHTMITEHYANVNWMQIFPKPPACNRIHSRVKIYVKLHFMKHSKYLNQNSPKFKPKLTLT